MTCFANYERRDGVAQEKCKSFSSGKEEANLTCGGGGGGFECNICLDNVQDPVVTLCGHLYCWPCIYKWINFQTSDQRPAQCPVCKSNISERKLIPLYNSTQEGQTEKPCMRNIPDRPSSGPTTSMVPVLERDEPVFGMYGQMVYARIFGNSEALNSYQLVENSNPRLRRHLVEIDRSLSRVCFFLSCCVIFCLLLF
ncbi:E3 ubiquitin-protein ligase RMA1H1-like [Impatiens glandulifera]|uniref:E3 ubiquitin-protein ligase RMA1H1-like n=1 Tax=Impatiens glandulifera TaxID=253017 RepID=UPI001FB084EA|nr:E3 ubiquitin-protein ligase RMA1H1-like [Impatiens glandulifera]